MTTTAPHPAGLGIRQVSERTGLSLDTLRWYEREGLLPPAPRAADGRRVYPERIVAFVELVVALRRTGMSVADARTFTRLTAEGAATHGRRMALLEQQRERVDEQQCRLDADRGAIEAKIDHYRRLIDAGLDCDGDPVDETTADLQRRTA